MSNLSTVRVEKNQNYTVMSNQHLRDKHITLKAKGLMSYMLSLPPEWDFSINGLAQCLGEGKRSIGNALNELIDRGYLKREQNRKENKFCGYKYTLYEIPYPQNEDTHNEDIQNELQINTKEINTKEINTYIGDNAPKRKKGGFVPPTKQDIQNYIAEKIEAGKDDYKNIDVDTFYNYYSEADWHMSNGKKVKSWKQCLVTWASREWNQANKKHDDQPRHPYVADMMAREEEMYC